MRIRKMEKSKKKCFLCVISLIILPILLCYMKMIQVWHALPDDASTEEERMAIETLRNEASDDLRNILGLNVTTRLLNTFNPLNVKVHFSTKPDRKYLRNFLKRYNFLAFKRIVRVNNTFAAQVKTIADYDDLCSNKNIFCGAAKITIAPCYRFAQCPKNLKSMYGSPEDDNSAENKEHPGQDTEESTAKEPAAKETEIKKEELQDKSDHNSSIEKTAEIQKDKVNEIVENSKTVVKIESKVNTKTNVTSDKMTVEGSESVKPTPKASEFKTDVQKSKTDVVAENIATNKKTPSASVPVITENDNTQKTVASNKTTNVTPKTKSTEDKTTPANNTANNTKTNIASVTKPSSANDNKTANISNTEKANVNPTKPAAGTNVKAVTASKPASSKTTATKVSVLGNGKKTTAINKTPNVAVAKPTVVKSQSATAKTSKIAPTKAVILKNVTKPKSKDGARNASKQVSKKADTTNVKKQLDTKKLSKGDDFEELDDNELYQYLMSAGIVLDECSGSDDE